MAEETQTIVQIDPALCDDLENNRVDYSYAEELAQSIAEHGQIQPIAVFSRPDLPGRYGIIYGHTRVKAAAILGIPVKAIVRNDLEARARYAMTLSENDARQDTNDIEKANGYRRAIGEYGYTVEELARQIGKRQDYISRRLDLLELIPDYQHMIAMGQLPITYGSAMSGLRPEYQKAAIDRLVAYENKHDKTAGIEWFRAQCADLLSSQNQSAFDFGLWGDSTVQTAEELEAAITLPADPANYRPAFDPVDLEADIARQLDKWAAAGRQWADIGKGDKAAQCALIVSQLRAFAAAMGARKTAAGLESDRQALADKIRQLLEDRGAMTAADLYRYANATKRQLQPIISYLVEAGDLLEEKSGRGYRYSVAV